VASARGEVFERLSRQVFAMMWRRQGSRGPAPQRTREYLGHVAAGESSHARIADAMETAPTSLAQLRHDLIARGVLVSVDGALDFGIPMMREFVTDQLA
jgi:hypothetical protein